MEKKISLFVVDDEQAFRDLMVKAFNSERYALEVFSSGKDVLKAVREKEFNVGIIDIKMPEMDGLELLRKLVKMNLLCEFIMLTGQASIATAIEAMRLGCYDYLAKPIRLDELEIVVQKAFEKRQLSNENLNLKEELQLQDKYHDIVGKSAKIKQVLSLVDKVARTSSPVLVTGESGTGKELVARAIHKNSPRADKPFIVIDCAALSDSLLENELFGHEKGAFTDATSLKRGLFEVADGGTLFIDEIGEMKLPTQAKLLRVIETHQFRRLGGTCQLEADVRIVAATNRNLSGEIRQGNFREDLYYRLNVFHITLPALRERKEDIPFLVRHFIQNNQVTPQKKRIREEDIQILMNYNWPGNVRELANVIERALIVANSEFITAADFPADFGMESVKNNQLMLAQRGLDALIGDFEKKIIADILRECDGNKIEVARVLKISRANLYRRLRKYDLLNG